MPDSNDFLDDLMLQPRLTLDDALSWLFNIAPEAPVPNALVAEYERMRAHVNKGRRLGEFAWTLRDRGDPWADFDENDDWDTDRADFMEWAYRFRHWFPRARFPQTKQPTDLLAEAAEPLSARSDVTSTSERRAPVRPGTTTARCERRAAVNAYIAEVWRVTGERLTRTAIWKSARYKTRTEFERWERCDPKATKTATERFQKILSEKPHLK